MSVCGGVTCPNYQLSGRSQQGGRDAAQLSLAIKLLVIIVPHELAEYASSAEPYRQTQGNGQYARVKRFMRVESIKVIPSCHQ